MHKDKARVGDVVRSYDFKPSEGSGDCYIEGFVIEKTSNHYKIAVQNRVWDGEQMPVHVGEYVYTPFEVHSSEYADRIQILIGKRSWKF